MLQQHRATVEVDHARVGQDAQAGATRVVLAKQEVTVAADEVHRHATVGQYLQCIGHRIGGGRGRVVADPGFEQVAEDVQRIGAGCLLAQEAQEQVGDLRTAGVQVQVGNEQRGHAGILGHQR